MKALNFLLSTFICTAPVFISCSSDNDSVVNDLEIEKNTVTLRVGESGTVGITNGNGSYSVVSTDENVAKASISTTGNQSVLIQAVGKGDATVTVKDLTNSQTKNIAVIVNAYLALDTYELVASIDEISTANITQGVGPYSVTYTKGGIVSAFLNGSVISIVGILAGEDDVIIADGGSNETAVIKVKVFNNLALGLEGNEVTVIEEESQTIDILSGSGEYSVEIANNNIATVTVENSVLKITALSQGNIVVKVIDNQTKQTAEFTLKVSAPFITFSTNAAQGATLTFSLDADVENRSNVWIDWNNNNRKDDGEEVTNFNELRGYTATGSSTFTLYGKVKRFTTHSFLNLRLITGVDISNNSYLTSLALIGHSVSSFDMSKNPNLKRLDLSSNPALTKIDYPNESKLTYLSISGTSQNSLDVSTLMDLDSLYCITSNLSEIKIGNLPKLRYLSVWNNTYKSIDVTGCPELLFLNISQCGLTELDLSRSAKLEELYATSNGTDAIHSFNFSSCVNLRVISAPRNGLTTEETASMLNSIPNPEKLTSLLIWSNDIRSLDLSRFSGLKTIDCFRNAISGEGATTLVNSLPTREVGEGAVINIIDKSPVPSPFRIEENVITVDNINVVKAKNWGAYNQNSGGGKMPYSGS